MFRINVKRRRNLYHKRTRLLSLKLFLSQLIGISQSFSREIIFPVLIVTCIIIIRSIK